MTEAAIETERDLIEVEEPRQHVPATRSTADAALTPFEFLSRVIDSGMSGDALEKMTTTLMAMQERQEANQARRAFNNAMADLRTNLPPIVKRREVDFTTSKGRTHYQYEDLSLVTEALSPVMAQHGLSFRWRTDTVSQPGMVIVTCVISHRDGHSEEYSLSGAPDDSGNKNPIQQIGSTVTYLQRYTLKAAVGVAAAPDDDAKAADATISGKQLDELRALVAETNTDEAQFCKHLKVEALADLSARKVDYAFTALRSKRVNTEQKPPASGPAGKKGDSNDLSDPGANVRTSQPDRSAVTQGGGQRKPSPAPSTEDSAVETAADLAGGDASRSASTAPGEPTAPHAPSFSGADAANIREALATQLNAGNPMAAEEAFFAFLDKLGRPRGRLGEALAEVRKHYLRYEGDEIVLLQLNALVDALIDGPADA